MTRKPATMVVLSRNLSELALPKRSWARGVLVLCAVAVEDAGTAGWLVFEWIEPLSEVFAASGGCGSLVDIVDSAL